MAEPLVSIVLPTYNGARYLEQSIESCLAQSHRNWELIVVDDASRDATPQIIERYLELDPRIRSVRHASNRRLPAALNTGFAQARGEYLTWTSDDNLYRPQALGEMVALLEGHPECAMTFADFTVIDESGAEAGKGVAGHPGDLHMVNCVGPCFLYRRTVLERLGGYADHLFLVEDYDYWLRVWCAFAMMPLHQDLYLFRSHGGSLTQQRRQSIALAVERLLVAHLPALKGKGRVVVAQTLLRLARVAWRNRHPVATLGYLLRAAVTEPRASLRMAALGTGMLRGRDR